MVTVAKSFDSPIKLLFPRDIFSPNSPFSMLGLGDIVIPGTFISLLLKFDGFRAIHGSRKSKKKAASKQKVNNNASTNTNPQNLAKSELLLESGNFSKPYFYTNFFFYVVGLGTTVLVMHVFQAAQPALLYLVPACLGSSLITALVRGEIKELFNYDEHPPSPSPPSPPSTPSTSPPVTTDSPKPRSNKDGSGSGSGSGSSNVGASEESSKTKKKATNSVAKSASTSTNSRNSSKQEKSKTKK